MAAVQDKTLRAEGQRDRNGERTVIGFGRARRWLTMAACGFALSGCMSFSSSELPQSGSLYGNYLAGRHAGISRNTEDAAEYFARALSQDPQNQTILERAFLLSLTAGQQDETRHLAGRIVRLRPDDRLARLTLAIDAISSSDYDEALEHLDRAGDGPLTQIVNTLLRTWAFAGKGYTATAVGELSNLGPETDLALFAAYHRALVYDLGEKPGKAETEFAEALALSSGSSHRIVQAYGRFLERRDRTADAKALYRDFLANFPGHPIIEQASARVDAQRSTARLIPNARAGAAEALYGLASAIAQDQSSMTDLPIVYLRLSLWLRDDLNIARTLLADQLERTQRPEAATAVYARIEPSSPLWIASRIRIARGLQRLERPDEARALLEDVIDVDADNTDVLATIGDILHTQEQYEDAAMVYRRAIATIDEEKDYHWTIFYRHGVVSERIGEWDRAEASLKKALALNPDNAVVLNDLGYFWIDRHENLDEAIDMIRRAVDRLPDRGDIIDSLGWGYYRLGQYDKAVEYLEKAIALMPGNSVINDHLGDAYWQVGRRLEARFQWKHALATDPDDREVEKIKRKLIWGLEEGDKTIATADNP